MDKEYRAYMIRLTRKPSWESWRVSLESVHSDEAEQFDSEVELLRYLARQLRPKSPKPDTKA